MSVDLIIVSPTKELAEGFEVRRALPSLRRRMVGPFIFFDEMGPALLGAGEGLDVRPHPHIGLATVTYLFDGELLHRDSLGYTQNIVPGELNWMTAGSGIVHSERTPEALRPIESRLFGIQAWVALPKKHEEIAPSFIHHGSAALPIVEGGGVHLRVIAGELHGARSPMALLSELFYAEALLDPGAELALPPVYEERAVYVVEGSLELPADGTRHESGRLLVLKPGQTLALRSPTSGPPTRLMLLGGPPMDGPRHIWWNFVSSSRPRIEAAKAAWQAQQMGTVPGETEWIPIPGAEQSTNVRYP